MGAIALFKSENFISKINDEIAPCSYLGEKKLSLVRTFLEHRGITTLADVTWHDVSDFSNMIHVHPELSETQRSKFASALETVVRTFYSGSPLEEELAQTTIAKDIQKKLFFFLSVCHVDTLSDIDVIHRDEYESFLISSGFIKITEYTKAIDTAKLYAISLSKSDLRPKKLKYENKVMYLAYHPDYEIAQQYFQAQVKEPLFFDFSLDMSETIKRQIFALLKHFVEECPDYSRHYRIQNWITPLWHFLNFCYKEQLTDISTVLAPTIDRFKSYTEGMYANTFKILDTVRKFTFMLSPIINWNATAWYMDKFSLTEGRINMTSPTEAFYFDDIANDVNRGLLMEYMKYQLGLSQRLTVRTIYQNYSYIKVFLRHCDEQAISLTSISKAEIEKFISLVFAKDLTPTSTNTNLSAIAAFLQFLELKELIPATGFHFEYYKVKEVYLHHDKSVAEEDIDRILAVLDQFPEDVRLMFLNLWCIGLRVNEVCSIKGDAYLFDGTTAWFLIYQSKAKREKRVPIPYELYSLMTDYIKENAIKPSDYVFPSKTNPNQPYRSATFKKQMHHYLDITGVSEHYHFLSHGFRHTIATDLYMEGTNIQTIRQYLGHASIEMTKQYVDHLPGLIEKQNEDFFKNHNSGPVWEGTKEE